MSNGKKLKLTPFSKIVLLVIIGAGCWFGFKALSGNQNLMNTILPKKEVSSAGKSNLSKSDSKDVIKVCVVTWGGYAGGQYFNGGFKASKESRFYKEYGILVEFVLMDDFNASREAWKSDNVNLQWITADAFPTEVGSLKEYDPRIIFQADWSRGGDAIVVRPGIRNVSDLRGKKISVAYGTPSHTFILWMLKANNMTNQDVELVQVQSAVDAAAMYKSGSVDAAVVWSPDDQDCVAKVKGTKILKSTKEATHIIADVFYAKEKYIENNQEKITKLIEGWMRGAAEINTSDETKQKAAQILSEGLNQDVGFCLGAINNARLCTFGDNKGFFTIDGCNACVTGEQLYADMSILYQQVGIINQAPPVWRLVTNTSLLRKINLAGVSHEAEGIETFAKPTVQEAKAEAFASKAVSIVFATGSSALDDNATYILDKEVVPVLKAFGNARVRVEGNTDNVGEYNMNVSLSKKRANSAIQYFVSKYYFDADRFVVVGNGPNKPVADNETDQGRAKNRRTEVQLLN